MVTTRARADRGFGVPAVAPGQPLVTPGRIAATVISAALRAAAAATSGLLLIGGIALLLWALTPGAESNATALLRGSAVVYAAAHFLPVSVGGVPVTIRPLLLTLVAVAVIASSAGRARPVRGRLLEALHATVFAIGYAILVDLATALFAPRGDADAGLLAPLCVAAFGALLGVALHRTAWNRWWRRFAAPWLQVGLRAGMAATCLLIAAGALATVIGLVTSFPDATAVARLAAPSGAAGFGLLLLCLAFLPNAVVAGVGYVSGAGFSLGAGQYSPLVVHTTELPAIPLLTAAPDAAEVSRSALVAFGAPAAAAALIALVACRMLATRRDRLFGSALASLLVGLAVLGLAAAARGGVAGGPWAATGVAPLLAGGLVTGVLLAIAGTWSTLSGLRRVAWVAREIATARSDGDVGGDGAPVAGQGAEAGGDEPAVAGQGAEAERDDLAEPPVAVIDAGAGRADIDGPATGDSVTGVDAARTETAEPATGDSVTGVDAARTETAEPATGDSVTDADAARTETAEPAAAGPVTAAHVEAFGSADSRPDRAGADVSFPDEWDADADSTAAPGADAPGDRLPDTG